MAIRKIEDIGVFIAGGGPREDAIRRMLIAATYWIDEHPNVQNLHRCPELDKLLESICPGFSGGMFNTMARHLEDYRSRGSWEAYCAGLKGSQ